MRARGWIAALSLLAVACGSETTGPDGPPDNDRLSERLETESFLFLYSPGDRVDPVWQEAYHRWVHDALDLPSTPRVEYRKYRNVGHMSRMTGFRGNAWADPDRRVLHTIWPTDNHEVVHVLVNHHLGRPPGLFSEGVAVAHQGDPVAGDTRPRWSGRLVHEIASEREAAGEIPPLADLIETEPFADLPSGETFPLAGSFVRFLLDEAGTAPFHELARRSRFDDPEAMIQTDFEAAYGEGLDVWWGRWLAFLRSAR